MILMILCTNQNDQNMKALLDLRLRWKAPRQMISTTLRMSTESCGKFLMKLKRSKKLKMMQLNAKMIALEMEIARKVAFVSVIPDGKENTVEKSNAAIVLMKLS